MLHLNTEAALKACMNNDLESLQHLIPSCLGPDSRVQKVRLRDRPYSAVPFLCLTIAYGSLDCFEYLIEKGATTYYADLILYFIILFIIFLR